MDPMTPRYRSPRIGRTLFVLFLLVPLAELYVLIKVGQVVGAIPTIALLVLISVAGSWLIKREGIRCFSRIRAQLHQQRMPTDDLIDSGLILLAGALMLSPGFLTDIVGILLLIPPCRKILRTHLKKRYGKPAQFIDTGW
jgi:UPF0716 protein FxsA